MSDCVFCDEVETREFIVNGKSLGNRVIFESNNFVVFPALGQIVEGYLLIVSKEHHISTCVFSDDLFSEFHFVKEKVKEVLASYYQPPLFFEHGATSLSNKGGCCIDHAHIHAVPIRVNLFEELSKNFSYNQIYSYDKVQEYYGKNLPYFLIENNLSERYLFEVNSQVSSQYIRRIIADKIGKPDIWDWRKHYGLDELLKTIEKLKDKF